jgi:hypothetical protein
LRTFLRQRFIASAAGLRDRYRMERASTREVRATVT